MKKNSGSKGLTQQWSIENNFPSVSAYQTIPTEYLRTSTVPPSWTNGLEQHNCLFLKVSTNKMIVMNNTTREIIRDIFKKWFKQAFINILA